MYVVANHIVTESSANDNAPEQLDFFTDYEKIRRQKDVEVEEFAREKEMQKAMLKIKKKYGKNAVVKGMNLTDGATTIERNGQVGGHKK